MADRRTLEADARAWVSAWASRGDWPIAVSRLLLSLDRECRAALTAGRTDVFGSVANLRPEWDYLVASNGELPPNDEAFRNALFAATLNRMVADGDLLYVNDRQRARSRFFETVHYLRNLRQRTAKNSEIGQAPELVEMIKAEVAERERPLRRVDHADLMDKISNILCELSPHANLAWGDSARVLDHAEWAEDVFSDFLSRAFSGIDFADFQVLATREILRAGFEDVDPPKAIAIAAGTGFGKTEAFLLPLLFHALIYKAIGVTRDQRGASALMVYPRRDLCNDQAARIVGYLIHLNAALKDKWSIQFGEKPFAPLRVAIAHGGLSTKLEIPCPMCGQERRQAQLDGKWTPDDEQRARLIAEPDPQSQSLKNLFRCERMGAQHQEAAQCLVYQISKNSDSSDLVVTNLDTLHRRLMDRHGHEMLFAPRCLPPRFVVLDEMHIYEGQTGAHAANIVRRLRHKVRRMRTSGKSELIPIGASATVFDSSDLLMRLSGVRTVDIASVEPAAHERETQGLEYFAFLQSPGNRLQRMGIGDDEEDDPEAEVQHRFVSEQATMLQAAMCLQHTMKTPDGTGIRKRRTLGFVDSLDLAARLARNYDNAEWQDAGPSENGAPRPMKKTPLYAMRLPSGRPDAQADLVPAIAAAAAIVRDQQPPILLFPTPGQDCPRFNAGDCEQPPHHIIARCDRYESGECWYCMGRKGEEGLRPTVTQKHQSGRRNWASPDLHFKGTDDPNAWRLLISTSALEVGFDNPELIATWQFHAPPSVAGFLQRKGRGGRGVADRPITMMVLGSSAADVFAFQHHDRYVAVDRARDLACWIDPENPALNNQHIVAALFDFCAAQGKAQAYSTIDFTTLNQVLTSQWLEVVKWIADCFDLVPGRVENILRTFRNALQEIWLRPLVPEHHQWGDASRQPTELFRALKPGELRTRAQMLTGETEQLQRAREWLQAMAAQKGDSYQATAPDFFSTLPRWALPDNDLRLPTGTIGTPLGREIELYNEDGSNIGRDSAEFALNVFLPGGFKIRFDNRLWAAPWEPPQGWQPPTGSQLSRAVLTVQEPDQPSSASVPDIRAHEARIPLANFLDKNAALGTSRRAELVSRLGDEANIVVVSGLKLRSVGGIRSRRFTFDRAQNVVRVSGQNVPAGDRETLVRDPNLSPQREIIPLRPDHQAGDLLKNPPFSEIRHYRRQPLLILHTGNIVHCFPDDGGERTIAVHFHAADDPSRRLTPAAIVRTEALELVPESPPEGLWEPKVLANIFWQRVSENLARELVIERGLLRSSYLVEGCLEALSSLEESIGEFTFNRPDATTLLAKFKASIDWLPELNELIPHISVVTEVLHEAADFTSGIGRLRAWSETLAAAFVRAVADRLHTSPSAFRTLVEPSGSRWRILIYDDNEGGSGNARRVRQALSSWPDLKSDLFRLLACPVAESDQVVSEVLASRLSPETLTQLCTEGRLQDRFPRANEPMILRRLARLVEEPDVAAFNLHAGKISAKCNAQFGGLAPFPSVLRALNRSPALDPRAEALRRRFKEGLVPELPSRLRAVRPLCTTGCPYCVGLWESGYANRTLTAGFNQ